MRCPHCGTENRDDRAICYHCSKDLMMIRLIVNKAKQHFNNAVELAERQHYGEALGELNDALELNSRFVEALVLRGTILARLERFEEAKESWGRALGLNPQAARAHRYLGQIGEAKASVPLLRRARTVVYGAVGVIGISVAVVLLMVLAGDADAERMQAGWEAIHRGDLVKGREVALALDDPREGERLLSAIEGLVELKIDQVAILGIEGDGEDVRSLVAELSSYELTKGQRAELQRTLNQIERVYRQRVENLLATQSLSRERLKRIGGEFSRMESILGEQAEDTIGILRAQVAGMLEERLRQIEAVAAGAEVPEDTAIVDQQLFEGKELAVAYSKHIAPVNAGEKLEELARVYTEKLAEQAAAAARAGEKERYEKIVAYLESFSIQVPENLESARQMRAVLIDRLREEHLGQLVSALDENRTDEALRIYNVLAIEYGFEPDETIQQRVHNARRQLAIESYYALMDMAGEFDARQLSREQAVHALALIENARGPLPPRLSMRADENITYFAYVAHLSLGEEQAAREEAVRLRKEHPESPYLPLNGNDTDSAE